MSKPIGYFTGTMPGDGSLLDDMQQAWGSTFEVLNNSERLWLLSSVTGMMTADTTEDYNPHEVSDLTSATERFDELSFYEQVALAEALIHQIKYHRYNR
ncbi:hypothetical protein PI95_032210 [Hassallia byssoidea VB512170]|uniref:Uncharacterized protein n=1 Tax=Hassallia byssoidea VB512170 TaxID=1304833 RepID=A0A846HJJ2_9CYAN|nr:hypothetical protein [Hassalia byssoidea]NEU77038.1 hypothetical protein [Hassalia byssoidea VB512170]